MNIRTDLLKQFKEWNDFVLEIKEGACYEKDYCVL